MDLSLGSMEKLRNLILEAPIYKAKGQTTDWENTPAIHITTTKKYSYQEHK